MTCKDCKSYDTCTIEYKSAELSADGDSWANWCDDFDSIHASKVVEKDGYTIFQSGYNYHVSVFDNEDKLIFHAQVTKELTETELSEYLKVVLETLSTITKRGIEND